METGESLFFNPYRLHYNDLHINFILVYENLLYIERETETEIIYKYKGLPLVTKNKNCISVTNDNQKLKQTK